MKISSKKQEIIIVMILALFTVISYFNSINGSFIFDDNHMIVNNTFIIHSKYFHNFFKGFVTSYPVNKGMCRPLLMLTFAFDYANSKLNPLGYHITNMILHFLNGILIYFLLKNLQKNSSKTLLTLISLLFIVHPINTEAVTYISSRSDLLITFFVLAIFLL